MKVIFLLETVRTAAYSEGFADTLPVSSVRNRSAHVLDVLVTCVTSQEKHECTDDHDVNVSEEGGLEYCKLWGSGRLRFEEKERDYCRQDH